MAQGIAATAVIVAIIAAAGAVVLLSPLAKDRLSSDRRLSGAGACLLATVIASFIAYFVMM